MIRRIGIVIVGVMAYLIVLAEIEHMDNMKADQVEQQRNFNAHQ